MHAVPDQPFEGDEDTEDQRRLEGVLHPQDDQLGQEEDARQQHHGEVAQRVVAAAPEHHQVLAAGDQPDDDHRCQPVEDEGEPFGQGREDLDQAGQEQDPSRRGVRRLPVPRDHPPGPRGGEGPGHREMDVGVVDDVGEGAAGQDDDGDHERGGDQRPAPRRRPRRCAGGRSRRGEPPAQTSLTMTSRCKQGAGPVEGPAWQRSYHPPSRRPGGRDRIEIPPWRVGCRAPALRRTPGGRSLGWGRVTAPPAGPSAPLG